MSELQEAKRVCAVRDEPHTMSWWAKLDNGLQLQICPREFEGVPHLEYLGGGKFEPLSTCRRVELLLGIGER